MRGFSCFRVSGTIKCRIGHVHDERNNEYESRVAAVAEVTPQDGRPSDVIVEVAQEEDVDLIVMGSRGNGGIVGFLGSTSRHVVEACTKPIRIVE